jgi:hypothetical protein
MRKQEVLELLREHREELRTHFGVGSIALFGSYARDEARPDSDVDLLVEFEQVPSWALFNDLVDHLEALFGTRVDLVAPGKLKPGMRPSVERELIRVA